MIKVMLVDDHEIVRLGLKMLIDTIEGYEVVVEAENGQVAFEYLDICDVDLILLDLNMPIMDGLSFMKAYSRMECTIPVVILTTLDEQDKIKLAISYGAKSYLLKDASRDTLQGAMEAALRGEMLMTEAVMSKLISPSNKAPDFDVNPEESFGLSEKELYVLVAVAKGETNRSIAIDMGIAERTVKAHLSNIFSKMDVSSRSEAAAKAIAKGIIHL